MIQDVVQAPAQTRVQKLGQLREIAKSFESIFLNMLMKSMRDSVQKGEMFHGGRGEDVFSGLLDDQLIESASQGQGLGIGDMIYKRYEKYIRGTEETTGKQVDSRR